jgi:hypothetical protein
MASPAEVGNDMAAHAAYWQKRDNDIFRTCNDAARVIRMYLDGEKVDGRTYSGLHRRLLNLTCNSTKPSFAGAPNFDRALSTLYALRAEAAQ